MRAAAVRPAAMADSVQVQVNSHAQMEGTVARERPGWCEERRILYVLHYGSLTDEVLCTCWTLPGAAAVGARVTKCLQSKHCKVTAP